LFIVHIITVDLEVFPIRMSTLYLIIIVRDFHGSFESCLHNT
jgi:hypothetical protein